MSEEKTARNNRIKMLRAEGKSFHAISLILYEEGHGPITPQALAQAFKRMEAREKRSLKRLQDLNEEAGR